MLTDKIKFKIIAGRGGDGAVYFDITRKPSGGDGGNGGNIYIEGTNSLYDLSKLSGTHKIKAENGERGGKKRSTGKSAEDVIIKLPITSIVNLNGENAYTIDQIGQREVVAKGGRGGLGNFYFRKGQMRTREKYTPGKPGEEFDIEIELRLKADVLFIGFPNAGKSSMLNTLTNTNVKVASYPFTTLEPHLGVAEDLILMDLPGLIEGASEGKGIGKEFVSHFEKAKVIAHFISLENENLLDAYQTIRNELKELDPRLVGLPEIIVISKSDLYDEDNIKSKLKQIDSVGSQKIITTSYDFDKSRELISAFKSYSR